MAGRFFFGAKNLLIYLCLILYTVNCFAIYNFSISTPPLLQTTQYRFNLAYPEEPSPTNSISTLFDTAYIIPSSLDRIDLRIFPLKNTLTSNTPPQNDTASSSPENHQNIDTSLFEELSGIDQQSFHLFNGVELQLIDVLTLQMVNSTFFDFTTQPTNELSALSIPLPPLTNINDQTTTQVSSNNTQDEIVAVTSSPQYYLAFDFHLVPSWWEVLSFLPATFGLNITYYRLSVPLIPLWNITRHIPMYYTQVAKDSDIQDIAVIYQTTFSPLQSILTPPSLSSSSSSSVHDNIVNNHVTNSINTMSSSSTVTAAVLNKNNNNDNTTTTNNNDNANLNISIIEDLLHNLEQQVDMINETTTILEDDQTIMTYQGTTIFAYIDEIITSIANIRILYDITSIFRTDIILQQQQQYQGHEIDITTASIENPIIFVELCQINSRPVSVYYYGDDISYIDVIPANTSTTATSTASQYAAFSLVCSIPLTRTTCPSCPSSSDTSSSSSSSSSQQLLGAYPSLLFYPQNSTLYHSSQQQMIENDSQIEMNMLQSTGLTRPFFIAPVTISSRDDQPSLQPTSWFVLQHLRSITSSFITASPASFDPSSSHRTAKTITSYTHVLSVGLIGEHGYNSSDLNVQLLDLPSSKTSFIAAHYAFLSYPTPSTTMPYSHPVILSSGDLTSHSQTSSELRFNPVSLGTQFSQYLSLMSQYNAIVAKQRQHVLSNELHSSSNEGNTSASTKSFTHSALDALQNAFIARQRLPYYLLQNNDTTESSSSSMLSADIELEMAQATAAAPHPRASVQRMERKIKSILRQDSSNIQNNSIVGSDDDEPSKSSSAAAAEASSSSTPVSTAASLQVPSLTDYISYLNSTILLVLHIELEVPVTTTLESDNNPPTIPGNNDNNTTDTTVSVTHSRSPTLWAQLVPDDESSTIIHKITPQFQLNKTTTSSLSSSILQSLLSPLGSDDVDKNQPALNIVVVDGSMTRTTLPLLTTASSSSSSSPNIPPSRSHLQITPTSVTVNTEDFPFPPPSNDRFYTFQITLNHLSVDDVSWLSFWQPTGQYIFYGDFSQCHICPITSSVATPTTTSSVNDVNQSLTDTEFDSSCWEIPGRSIFGELIDFRSAGTNSQLVLDLRQATIFPRLLPNVTTLQSGKNYNVTCGAQAWLTASYQPSLERPLYNMDIPIWAYYYPTPDGYFNSSVSQSNTPSSNNNDSLTSDTIFTDMTDFETNSPISWLLTSPWYVATNNIDFTDNFKEKSETTWLVLICVPFFAVSLIGLSICLFSPRANGYRAWLSSDISKWETSHGFYASWPVLKAVRQHNINMHQSPYQQHIDASLRKFNHDTSHNNSVQQRR